MRHKFITMLLRHSILFLFLLFLIFPAFSQDSDTVVDYKTEIENYRKGRNIKMMYSDGSPLTQEQRKSFKGLKFYDIDEKFKVTATLEIIPEKPSVFFKTSTDRQPEYLKYVKITFTLEGQEISLFVYQSKKLLETRKEVNFLFIPFKDATTGDESYKNGRYVDCDLPAEGNTVIIDFNKAYNPYCSYNPKYSCVIPPEENHLKIKIEAGEKKYK